MLVINLAGASETKERTLREVPLANGRFDEDCVTVGNECVYKRHYRKYSWNLSQYNLMVSKRRGSKIPALLTPLDLPWTPAEFQKWSAHSRLSPTLHTLLTSFMSPYLYSSKSTPFDVDNACHGTVVGFKPPLVPSHEWQVFFCVCYRQTTWCSSPVRLFRVPLGASERSQDIAYPAGACLLSFLDGEQPEVPYRNQIRRVLPVLVARQTQCSSFTLTTLPGYECEPFHRFLDTWTVPDALDSLFFYFTRHRPCDWISTSTATPSLSSSWHYPSLDPFSSCTSPLR